MSEQVIFSSLTERMLAQGIDIQAAVAKAADCVRAESTKDGYRIRQKKFEEFCIKWSVSHFPADAETILAFLVVTSGVSIRQGPRL